MFIKERIGVNRKQVCIIFSYTKMQSMESKRICQSCSMPLSDPELFGTGKDGSRKKHYCKYCYENGQFTDPHITLEEMKTRVRDKMEEMKMDADTIGISLNSLPNLKRWRKVETIQLTA
jgi:hypothetical protein